MSFVEPQMVVHGPPGVAFLVRAVRKGERYGVEDRIVHDKDDPLLEFYDLRFVGTAFGPRGQLVARYNAETLACHLDGGLCLHGGVPEWVVPAKAMGPVIALACELTLRAAD